MKKLFLLIAAGMIAGGANAQEATSKSIVKTGASVAQKNRHTVADPRIEAANKEIAAYKAARNQASVQGTANKTTASGTRLYNWSDYLTNIDVMSPNNPYMWFRGEGKGVYSDGTGLIVDTISLGSYAMSITPWSAQFNDEGVPEYVGKVALNQQSTYTVDSIATYGFYGRNPQKTGVVDTMIFGLAWSTRTWRAWGETAVNAGLPSATDTVRCAAVSFNPMTCTVDTFSGQMTKVVKLELRVTDSSKTRLVVPMGQAIPAGNIVSCGITFKSGDAAYVPFTDTVFAGSATPDRPFKYGMWRPAMYEANTGQYVKYIVGSLNTGHTRHFPIESTSTFFEEYIPTYFYSSADYSMEWSDIDFIISSSAGVGLVGVNNVNTNIAGTNVYPNPATSDVKVKYTLNNASDVTVSILNTVGQVVASQKVANGLNGEVTFSTSNLTNGVYFYTVEANGQRTTNRFVVAH